MSAKLARKPSPRDNAERGADASTKAVWRQRHRSLDWLLGVSIRTKIMGIALGVALLLGLGVTRELQITFRRTLRQEIETEGKYVARNAVAHATVPLLAHDRAALHDLAVTFAEANRSVRYVVFRDDSGRILTHTFSGAVPREVRELPAPSATEEHRTQPVEFAEGPIRDIAMRPLRRDVGWVQVGMTEDWLRKRVRQMTDEMLFVVFLVTLAGIAAAYLLTSILTRPLRDLADVAQSVADGDFDQRAPVVADDEVGGLARVLNSMCAALSDSRDEIERKERMRVELLQRVIDAQEEERKRVARELHDHTSQSLTSLAVELKALETVTDLADARQQAQRLRELVSQTLGEVHHLAVELRPTLLDDLGLVAAVEHHIADFEEKMHVPVDFHAVGPWNGGCPPADVEIAVYRICQEALTNAARHAHAEHLSVVLTRRSDSVVAIIEDDGRGFLVEEVLGDSRGERNLGLFGMHERAALVGGKLTIESSPGHGATVFVEIPCPGNGEERRL